MGLLNTVLVFIVYSLNFLLLIGSIVTIYIFISEGRQKDIIENLNVHFEFLVFFSTVFIILAVIVALVSFMGCFGVAIDNDYLLIAYVIALGVLMVLQLIFSIILRNNLTKSHNGIKNQILTWIKESTKTTPQTLYYFQFKYSCCGIESYRDWESNTGFIPGSCCHLPDTATCPKEAVSSTRGCQTALYDEITKVLHTSFYVVFIIFGLEVLLAVCSILVIMDVGQSEEDNTPDEMVVSAFKKSRSGNKDNVKFEESIDTHDLFHQPDAIHSPITKEAVGGLYDEEKSAKRGVEDEEADIHEEESSEVVEDGKPQDESQEEGVEAPIRKTHDEEIYLDQQKYNEHFHLETKLNEVGKASKTEESVLQRDYVSKNPDEEEEVEEEEEEEEVEEEDEQGAGNQTRIEENIHVSKSKLSKRNHGVKIRKERSRDRKRLK